MEQCNSTMQLIIKAPNQNIDDQTVYCNWDWSIKKLKIHLSEIYPTKPAVLEQKLIYSGRLLHDHLVLKDILRHENRESSVHTLHLVCSRQNGDVEPEFSQLHSHSAVTSERSLNDGISSEFETELRQRVSQHNYVENPMLHQYGFGQPVPPTFSFPSPEYVAQLQAMQQLYASYFAQYMHNMQMIPNAEPIAVETTQNQSAVPENLVAAARHPAVPENRNIRMNAQGGPVLDDENELGVRDWLDYFYLCCRGFVLFSIVYFYSSPERLMLVVILALLAFFYQEGWLLARGRNNRPPENRQRLPQRNEIKLKKIKLKMKM